MQKIYDCVTFFQENLQVELRFNTLNDVEKKKLILIKLIFQNLKIK